MRIRHRLFVDLDEAGNPDQAWIERWVGGEPVRGWGVELEPFDTATEAFQRLLGAVDIQGTLL